MRTYTEESMFDHYELSLLILEGIKKASAKAIEEHVKAGRMLPDGTILVDPVKTIQ
jgi:hypothetical protein